MAELSASGSNTQDRDFEPTADMLVHDFDDEQTLEEEEKLQGETNFNNEIDDLTREGEMPLHELLKMYGYGAVDSAEDEEEGTEEPEGSEDDQSSSAPGKALSKKEDGVKESCEREEDRSSSSQESAYCSRTHSTAQLLSEPCIYLDGDAEESDDDDYVPSFDWKKEVKVGPMYQAETPAELCEYNNNEKVYENEDQLLWNPELLPENEVEEYLAEATKRITEETEAETKAETGSETDPKRLLVKDNEEALYELVKCNFNKEEALKRLKFITKPAKEELSAWAKEEQQDFYLRDEAYGNESNPVQNDKQFTLWRRKPSLHHDITDSTEQLLGETERTEVSQATASAGTNSWINSADSQPSDPACTPRSFNFCSDPNTSSSSTDAVARLASQRDDEESPERPLKKQKTGVDFRTAAVV
ncbi:mesoderm induction early response protein 1a [Trichomycterus rosablanca]|uniref:mesoderm induction early response protein 1a n=1 Tax=Trichomycterus rosablanca TaxID=2290929 RepID=UPI002F34F400